MDNNHILMQTPSPEIEDIALLNPVELTGLMLFMAIVAPSNTQADMAVTEAKRMVSQYGLNKQEVERSKAIASQMRAKHGEAPLS